MAEAKKIHLELGIPAHQAELFRVLVHHLNYQDYDDPTKYTGPYGVEILYEEPGLTNDEPEVYFSLWFSSPATAYWFALRLQEAKAAWTMFAAPTANEYPKFLFLPHMRIWLRYNSPEYFCLVSESHLQVRRERPQELWLDKEVRVITEADFLDAYQVVRSALRDFAQMYQAEYQRRGGEGNEWFYRNPKGVAANVLPQHLRLNSSTNECGRSWQLLYAHDVKRYDARRVASTQQEFEQQLNAMLAEVEAAATGKQEGGQQNG